VTDQSALLAAILAYPEDDTPRLVFSDWLDENESSVACERCDGTGCTFCGGEDRDYHDSCNECNRCDGSGFVSNGYAARGEFIRIQCEIFRVMSWRVPHNGGTSTGADLAAERRETLKGLRKRERELFLSAYPENRFLFGSGAWTYCLPGTPVAKGEAAVGSSVAVVEGGFVDSVSCPWDAWRDYGDAITAAQPVRRVTMTTEPPTEESPDHADNVDWLEFQGMPETAERLDELRKWCSRQPGQLRNLRPHHRVLVALLSARWPSVREWVLPPDPNLIPDHLQDSASAFIASGRMIEGEIIDVPLPPTR